ncbi:hypothetical protein ALI144C_26980 [Actinosynnema sp. ALI-1.44]|uniref:outer membrane protein assembly factor BamB family protein n=1 Tax=Actinosynnema sp. ALI-1.44 TaxID=1933779 RepID=UPI00097BF8F3|nr:PQQ-binding-like beta-propeller repeat protein [Actinosynnema sp. ALI-1.44]ONI79452.1 hypothetical protein ALI144C_26980 [Actinosynnema sp. ALI-1.44]
MPAWGNLLHAWAYRDSLIVATDGYVISYSRASGAQQWAVEPPTDVAGVPLFCGATPTVVGGRIALAYGSETHDRFVDCTHAAVVDVDTGKLGWHTAIGDPREGINGAPNEAYLDIHGDLLHVGWDDFLSTHRMSDGVQQSKIALRHDTGRCSVLSMTSLHLVARCLGPGLPDLSIASVSATGRLTTVKDHAKATAGLAIMAGRLVSTSPPILWVLDNETAGVADYLVLSPTFEVAHRITGTGSDLAMTSLGPPNTEGGIRQFRTLVVDQTLVTVTVPYPGGPNRVVAYDLATGQRRWESHAENARIVMPVAVEGSTVVMAADVGLIRFSLTDGSVASIIPSPPHDGTSVLEDYRFVWADGRAYAIHNGHSTFLPLIYTMG